MNELPCRTGQITALLKQLPPEALGGGLERQRAKGVAHLAQQHRQMPLKASPVTLNELAGALNFGTSLLAVKPSRDSGGVNRPIGLGKRGQTTHADSAVPTAKAPNPNPQKQSRSGADVTVVIGQGLQDVRMLAVGTVFRRRNLPMILVFCILL